MIPGWPALPPAVTLGKTRVWAYEIRDSDNNKLLAPANIPSKRETAFREMALTQTNRQGLMLLQGGTLGRAWFYHASAGMNYDFTSAASGMGAGAELGFRPRKSVELRAGINYETSASSANAGAAAWLVSFRATVYF